MANAKDDGRSASRSRQPTKSKTKSSVRKALASWKEFMPGVVCGGKLEPSMMKNRMDDCTTHHLKELRASAAFKAWERGEDLHAHNGRLETFLSFAVDQSERIREYLDSVDTKTFVKSLIVVVVVLVAIVGGVMQKQTLHGANELLNDGASDALLDRIREERRVENTENVVKNMNIERDRVEAQDGIPIKEVGDQQFESEMKRLGQKIDDLQLQVQLERKRAIAAKEKEDKMFEALEASTHKVHTLSKHVKDSETHIKALESNVQISIKHSGMLQSFNMLLLALETILVFSAMIAYVKSHRIRSAFLKARNSCMIAWRRQQRVLAVADEVYHDALRYKSEVEASDVGPKVSEKIINPWDPIISDLDSLIKSHVGVERSATPVQAMAALQAFFVDKKAREKDYIAEKEAHATTQNKINELEGKIQQLVEELEQSCTTKDQTQQNLESEVTSLREAANIANKQVVALEEQTKTFLDEKKSISEQLARSNAELERVAAYAASLEETNRTMEKKLQEAHDVRTHLDEFEKTINTASKISSMQDEDDDEELKENTTGNINEAVLGERIQKIRQLIQEANSSPFELLSPHGDLYDGNDVEIALKKLPVIGPMHISSSDSDDDFTTRQDESLHSMLAASETLSTQVEDYISILEGIHASKDVIQEVKEKKSTVERLRSTLEALIDDSQRAWRTYSALKAKRRQIDFLSEKEEQEHGEKELKAADALFYAREKEKDACMNLEKAQSVLRAALAQRSLS